MQQTDYFDELKSAVTNAPDYKTLYMVMNSVYMRSLNDFTRGIRISLSGTFAKTDHLLKERKAPKQLWMAINDTRQYFKQRHSKSETELKDHYKLDLRNLCEFLSLLTGEPVPSELTAHYPAKQTSLAPSVRLGEYIRVIVVHWDDDYAYCHSESTGNEELKVCYSHGNKAYNYDRGYLKGLFYEGAQFNLVRPYKHNDGIIYPDLWIFEPDYLIDISTVAGCFESYAHSEIVNLIKRITPYINRQANLLGYMASQLLDESIYQMPDTHSYVDSAKEFFSYYAMRIIAAEDFDRADFHKQARDQQVNIQHAIHQILPQEIGNFDTKNGIVEPSFYCEMLGLQGRMDYLQLNQKVLIEQKSGKGEFIPYDKFVIPKPKLEHTIQLLLYMAVITYNYRKQYESNNFEFRPFLLYSKYREGLYELQSRPKRLFEALKIRNKLAWNDIVRFNKDGFSILKEITPDQLNELNTQSPLWKKSTFWELNEILSPIKNCCALEQQYVLRIMNFIREEYIVNKLGNREKEASGFASSWHMSIEEKELNGTILTGLMPNIPNNEREHRINEVTFEMEYNKECRYITNLRIGDTVVIYPYSPTRDPDIRKTFTLRCILKSFEKECLTVKLRTPQSNCRIFDYYKDMLWAMEADFMEASFSSAYSNVYSFLSAPQQRRDLLLLQRPPKVDHSLRLKGDYKEFNDLSLRVKQARELFLIIGPPGTGKTSYGMLNTLREELLEPGSRVLLMAYTNRAVDEMCSKLLAEDIDFLRIGSELSCDKSYIDHHINTVSQGCANLHSLIYTIENYRVIVGTVHSFNGQLQYLSKQHFSLAIIDEASQLLESHLLGLLSCQSADHIPTIDKFVLIGDHKQLPAVVQQPAESSVVMEQELQQILLTDCRQSLFERLLKQYNGDDEVVGKLTKHGRMHPEIAAFPNEMFYNGELQTVPLAHQESELPADVDTPDPMERMLRTRRLTFISVAGSECPRSDKSNTKEAMLIANLLEHIYKIEGPSFDPSSTVGVIVPYRNQIATIRAVVSECKIPALADVTIDTVERFQGSQRKYIIYGFTIQKRHQLRFLTGNVFTDYDGTVVDRKLNVAMTRAQEHLIMVGNPKIVCQDPIFSRLVAYIKAHNGYYEEKEMH